METFKPLLPHLVFTLCIVATWGIIFVAVYRAIAQASIFKGPPAKVLALCVSILCVLGLFKPFICLDEAGQIFDRRGWIIMDTLLLVYGLLGLVIILSVIVRFVRKVFRGDNHGSSLEKSSDAWSLFTHLDMCEGNEF